MKLFSIKAKLSLAMAVVFIMLAAVEFYLANSYFQKAYREDVAHSLKLMCATLADSIESGFAFDQNALGAALKALPQSALANPAQAQKFLDERVTLQYLFPEALLLIASDGRLIAAHPTRPNGTLENFSSQAFFKSTLTQKTPTLSAAPGASQRNAEIIVAAPVLDSRGIVKAVMVGVADLAVSKQSIEEMLREKIGPEAHLYIASRNGTYLLHHGKNPVGASFPIEQTTLFMKALDEQVATGETIDCSGKGILASYQRLPSIDSVLMVSSPLALAYAPLDKAKTYFLGSIIFGTAVLMGFAWFVAGRIIAPVQLMTNHVKVLPKLSGDQRLLHLKRDDEIGILADAFDQLMADLENHQKELVETNHELERRSVELMTINRELEAFSSALSHDLKNPLASIRMSAEILQDNFSGKDDSQDAYCLSAILAQSARMSDLVDSMLLLSQASKANIKHEEVNLSLMAMGILMRLRSENPDRKIEWSVAPNVHVSGDSRLLLAVMENLIGNAWKYTSMNAETRIEFGILQDGKPVYYVQDNGVGFDMAQATRLFEPFQRLHTEKQFKGFGIGLTTAQRIIHRHGGEIWADSVPDQGTRFFFTVPAELAS